MTTFRPVGIRLPLSEIAALADATARLAFGHRRRARSHLVFGFRLRLPSRLATFALGKAKAAGMPTESGR